MTAIYDTAIIGLGLTGFSCVQFFHERGIPIVVTDSRDEPPFLSQLKTQYPDVPVYCGGFNKSAIQSAKQIMLSQGIPATDPVIHEILTGDIPIVSDIEIFAHYATKPIMAITGSNGKSTVTSLLAAMATIGDCNASVGGNLGPPALDLLRTPEPECYILEVSNFQLETTHSLAARVACILNLSPDHLDRYPNYQAYIDAKQRIYKRCETAIVNRDDLATWPKRSAAKRLISFGLDAPATGMFGLVDDQGDRYLMYGKQRLINVNEIAMPGTLGIQNSLAALAIGFAYGWPIENMLPALREFTGLAHRCQLLRTLNGVRYINDSKGTNVGATLAALNSIGQTNKGKIIWLAGGDGKGADFSDLATPVSNYVKTAIVYGRDAKRIAEALMPEIAIEYVGDLAAAVVRANELAANDDCVLLSPACASFDMFKNFAERGDVFAACVEELPK